jgi:DNA primase
VRRWDDRRERFVHLFSGRGNGYYFSPDFAWRPMRRLAIVEGELNAAAVYIAIDLPTIGIPGAGTGLSRGLAERIKECAESVVVMTDQDDAGRQLAERIINQLVLAGYERSRIRIPREDRLHRDPMDILRDRGLDYLEEDLKERIYRQGADLRPARRASTVVAKAAAAKSPGLNTKRALAKATGEEIVRRHAKYVPPEELEAASTIENYLTEEVIRTGANPAMARKTVRRWMVMNGITGRTALFMIYEVHGIKTGSRELEGKFTYQRQHHPLISKYRLLDEKYATVGFDIAKLLADAVAAIKDMVGEALGFFRKLAERIKKERDAFAAWIKDAPRLLGYILRRKPGVAGVSPPAAVAV